MNALFSRKWIIQYPMNEKNKRSRDNLVVSCNIYGNHHAVLLPMVYFFVDAIFFKTLLLRKPAFNSAQVFFAVCISGNTYLNATASLYLSRIWLNQHGTVWQIFSHFLFSVKCFMIFFSLLFFAFIPFELSLSLIAFLSSPLVACPLLPFIYWHSIPQQG